MPSVPKVAAFRQPPLTIPVELMREDLMRGNVLSIGPDPDATGRAIFTGGLATLAFLIAVSALAIWFTDPRMDPIGWVDAVPLLVLLAAAALLSWAAARIIVRGHRRLSLRLMEERGVPERVAMTHEVSDEGIVTSMTGRTLHQPWSSFGRMAETERLLVLASHAAREPVILRQDGLTPDARAALTRWIEEKAGRPDRSQRAAPALAEDGSERVEYLLTADDHTEEVLHNLEAAYAHLAWFRSSVLPWLVLCILFQAGPLLIWALDLRRPPFDAFLSSYVQTLPVGGWTWLVVTLGVAVVLQLARRPMLRSNARVMQETVYGTAMDHEPVTLTFSLDELRIVQGAYRDHIARETVVRMEDRPNHLVAILSTGAHYAVPRRAFAPGQEAAFRRFTGSPASGGTPASR